jgi:glucans biosynthesis protein
MGASYFRAAGPLDQYGLSARGLAINTALPGQTEEFPRFTDFWLEQNNPDACTIFALLDSPSVTGAYRFVAQRGTERGAEHGEAVTMTVAARVFTRRPVDRIGIAPLTSMFWYSETNRHGATDWRPEVHDSDGLAVWTGSGERIWRPLHNPDGVQTTSYVDADPKGFGLFQRDREFDNYQDDGVFYERRPSLWVEPLGPWGEGMVQLVELPTDDEIHDNIVTYWTTDRPTPAGETLSYDYRLHWMVEPIFGASPVGRVVSTRVGRAGVPGQDRPARGNKIVVDFVGGSLTDYQSSDNVVPVIEASSAQIADAYAIRVVGTDIWRVVFDVFPDSAEPVELRGYLRFGDEPLTETWLYLHSDVPFE